MKKDLLRLLGLFRPYTRWIIAGTLLTILVDLANIGLLTLSGWFITAMAISVTLATSVSRAMAKPPSIQAR